MAERRHDLLTIDREWIASDAALREWLARGLPVQRRRALPTDAPGDIPICFSRPAEGASRRCACTIPRAAILRSGPPPLLSEAAGAAPAAWRDAIAAVLAIGRARGVTFRVFGSLMWQHLTGETYLRHGSDLDLLCGTSSATDWPGLAGALAAIGGPPRLDGEFVLPDGAGVSWRECLGGGEVLGKFLDGVRLVTLGARAA